MSLTLASIFKFGLQLAVLPILARLLGPASFGLVALAMPLLVLANIASDAGLGNALVRHRESSRELESTVFWLCLASSLALAGMICLLAQPIARLLSQPRLVLILMALTLILPLGGALAVPNALISRARRF